MAIHKITKWVWQCFIIFSSKILVFFQEIFYNHSIKHLTNLISTNCQMKMNGKRIKGFEVSDHFNSLLLWCRNQPLNLQCKSMCWCLYHNNAVLKWVIVAHFSIWSYSQVRNRRLVGNRRWVGKNPKVNKRGSKKRLPTNGGKVWHLSFTQKKKKYVQSVQN